MISDPVDKRWEGQVADFRLSASYGELLGIDGEPVEFEWNNFPGLISLQILRKIQNDLQEQNIEPEKFEDRIISMSMFNDIEWTRKGNEENCISNSEKVKTYEKRISQGQWTFLGPGDERKWYGYCNYIHEGKWDSIASQMVQRFKETGRPVFTSASALSRGILRKLKGKETIHFNADVSSAEFLLRIHSANQLSIDGAVSSWCEEFGGTPHEKEDNSDKSASNQNEKFLKCVNSPEVNSSTEQSQVGVKNSEEHHTRKKITQTSLHPIKMKRF